MTESKEQILNCARDIFIEEGLAHFSMRRVAACVGVSATAIYRHFADKEDLLFQVLLRGFRIFTEYLRRVDEGQDPLACLDATADAYLNFALDERTYYEMMFMSSEQMTGLKRLNEEGANEMQRTFEILHRRVARAMEAGALKGQDSYLGAYAIWSYAHGQVALHLCGRAGLGREAFVATYRALVQAHIRHL